MPPNRRVHHSDSSPSTPSTDHGLHSSPKTHTTLDTTKYDRTSSATNQICALPAGVGGPRITTNKIPDVILPQEIPYARLILRRDRSTHFYDIGRAVERMHKNEQGCDCAVVCGKKRFLAHRVVLAAHSGYFKKNLYDNGDQMPVDVPADGVAPSAMEGILRYMYSGEMNINYQTAMDAMNTAQSLNMKALADKCSEFVDSILNPDNLMTTLELAERSGIQILYAEAYKRLAMNFYSQTKMTYFLLWDIDKVCRLLGNDDIIIETELHVFIAAMRWMNYKRSERKVHFKRLMDCVRWIYMTTEEVLKCVDMEHELIRSNDVRPILIDATWYTTLKSYDVTWKDYPIPLPRTRALRTEDPEKVVERVRMSIANANRHSSFDNLWIQHPKKTDRAPPTDRPPGRNDHKHGPITLLPERHKGSGHSSPKSFSKPRHHSKQGRTGDDLGGILRPSSDSARQGGRTYFFRSVEKRTSAPEPARRYQEPTLRDQRPSQTRNESRPRRATHDGITRLPPGPSLFHETKARIAQLRQSLPSAHAKYTANR